MSQDSVNAQNEPRHTTEQPSMEPSLDAPVTSNNHSHDELEPAAETNSTNEADPAAETNLSDQASEAPETSQDSETPQTPEMSPAAETRNPDPPADQLAHTDQLASGDQPDGPALDDALDDDDGDDDASDMPDEFDGDTSENVKPIEESETAEEDVAAEKKWYILKVQSNREKSICSALSRRVKIEGLDEFFGEIIVPTEDVAEFKNGKRRVVKRKLYPGYIVVNMVLNEETWFVVRETPGIGDFTGSAGKPAPMLQEEIDRIVKAAHPEEEDGEQIKTAIPFKLGDRVRIKEGTFENFEGDVEVIDEASGHVTVVINIFNRSTPVELEHWQVESV